MDYQRVVDAVRAYADDPDFGGGRGFVESWEAPALIAAKLSPAFDRGSSRTNEEYKDVERFDGQVRRAFDTMATEGILVKAGRGQQGPHGGYMSNMSGFWTHAGAARDAEALRARREQAALDSARWAEVRVKLAERGVTIKPVSPYSREHNIEISLDEWEKLLDLAGWRN